MVGRAPQVNFAKGEVSEEIASRFDVQAYASGVKRARNVRVRRYGGLAKRMGTVFVSEVLDASKPVRLVPFEFSREQTYALELGQGYMRVATRGGMVLEENLSILGIATGDPTVLHVPYHGYAVGDQVYLVGGPLGTPLGQLLSGRTWRVSAVPDDSHFAIAVDSTGLAFTTWSGGIERTAEPPPPEPDPVVPPPVDPPPPPPVGKDGRDQDDGNPATDIP